LKPVLTKALSDVRRHRLQSLVVFIISGLAITIGTMGGTLLAQSSGPYDRAFSELAGPHLIVVFDGRKVTRDQVAATASLANVTATAGPWLVANVPFEKGTTHLSATSSFNTQMALTVLGRDSPGGQLDRVDVLRGRWVQSPGEIVVTRAYADQNSLSVGDRLTALATAGKPVLTIVGEAVDVDPRPARAWVSGGQVVSLGPAETPPSYQMSYRFLSAAGRADVRADKKAIEDSVPADGISGSASYLDFRDSFKFNTSLVLTFLLAFGAMALASVAVIVANVVTGAVLASYREIGIMKAIGFTPRQVVMVFVVTMLLPALAAALIAVPAGALASKPLLDQAAAAMSLPPASPLVPAVDVLALVLGLAVVAAAAALPAWRAGRLGAVTAITSGTAPSGRRSASFHGSLWWWRMPRSVVMGVGDTFARPARASLTAIAILVGVATLVFAIGLYSAILKFNDLFGPANGSAYQVTVSRFGGYSDAATTALLQNQPDTNLIIGIQQLQATVPNQPEPIAALILKGDSAQLGFKLAEGRWFARPGEAVVSSVLNPQHWAVGQTVDARIGGHAVRVRIVGSCYCWLNLGMDWATYNAAVPDSQPTDYVVQLRPGTNPAAYVKRVSAAEPDFVFAQVNTNDSGGNIEAILNAMVAALAVILGAIAGLGVFNALLLTTRERARDIAILKALGMTPRQVSAMFTVSACVLGLTGALVGIPAGIVLYNYLIVAMARLANFNISSSAFIGQINPVHLVVVGLAGMLVAVLGASLPARWAARAPVVSVLNLE
jgi:putative ABC transport system permease protein